MSSASCASVDFTALEGDLEGVLIASGFHSA